MSTKDTSLNRHGPTSSATTNNSSVFRRFLSRNRFQSRFSLTCLSNSSHSCGSSGYHSSQVRVNNASISGSVSKGKQESMFRQLRSSSCCYDDDGASSSPWPTPDSTAASLVSTRLDDPPDGFRSSNGKDRHSIPSLCLSPTIRISNRATGLRIRLQLDNIPLMSSSGQVRSNHFTFHGDHGKTTGIKIHPQPPSTSYWSVDSSDTDSGSSDPDKDSATSLMSPYALRREPACVRRDFRRLTRR